jgi:hypothetical protein
MADSTSGKTLTQSILTYSYTAQSSLIPSGLGSANAGSTALQQIVDLLNEASAALAAREYQEAIAGYRAAESLIYAQIDPQWDPQLGPILRVDLPRDASLSDPLLSAACQWLNILSVPTPASPVRPSVAPATPLPAAITALHGSGLAPVTANAAATAETIADIRLASIYASQGNSAAAAAAVARTANEDPTTAAELKQAIGLSAAQPATSVVASRAVSAVPVPNPNPTPVPIPNPAPVPSPNPTPVVTTETAVSVLSNVPAAILAQRKVGIVTGSQSKFSVVPLQWAAAGAPDIASIKSALYTPHISATELPDALMVGGSLWQHALDLPYYYFFSIPLALAEAYQGAGDYEQAIAEYFLAAQYSGINTAVEGPFIWVQVANCYLSWGDVYYKQGDTTNALAQYSNVLQPGSTTPPANQLYTLTSLASAAGIAKALIPQLATLAATGISGVSSDDTLIATVLLKIFGREAQINASLDFWGIYAPTVPIWTFSYLQQVAINFAQLAQQAEQDVINFWSQAQAATLTQVQLQGQVAQAKGQVSAAQASLDAAKAQATAYKQAVTAANTRASDAKTNATDYQSQNSQALEEQAMAAVTNLGNDYASGLLWPYTSAGQMQESAFQSGDTQSEAIAEQWQAGVYSQQYQVDSMNRTATEMQQAATQAQDQSNAANAQVTASQANLAVANLQASSAQQALATFNADTFTPHVWRAMGNFMLDLYMGYMDRALSVAKLMEKAYNFENDTNLTYIQNTYPGVVEGLLAADALMSDIQEFTYDLATSTRGKLQLVKTSISLATNYGYLFDTELVPTGVMSFETTLDDFDSQYPGSYQGRIKSVSVALQGIVPPTGVSGTLTNGGISWYRLPSDIASGTNTSKLRIQNSDTLVISDYDPSQDGVLNSSDGNQLGIFEGAGVASTWVLSLPPGVNDIDYSAITDVVLTFLYEARFDPQLVPTVLKDLASRPGFYTRGRSIPLAWLYPDLFYAFQSTGTLTLTLSSSDFPFNQTAPVVTAAGVLLTSTTTSALNGVNISISPPGKTAASAATGAAGSISSQTNAALAGLVGGSALGDWVITISAAANPGLVKSGKLDLSAFNNMTLMFDYTFTPRS